MFYSFFWYIFVYEKDWHTTFWIILVSLKWYDLDVKSALVGQTTKYDIDVTWNEILVVQHLYKILMVSQLEVLN